MKYCAIVLLALLYGCLAVPPLAADEGQKPRTDCIPACPDYTKAETWASRPANPEKPVDVFYVYPTIYPEEWPRNMDVFNTQLRADVQGLLRAQAGVYSPAANLYAPYYRQVSFALLDPTQDMTLNAYFRIGADDVHRAFNYYLNHLNQGRPFILAAHSQGAVVVLDLLKSRFKDKKLQEQLVAAYAIGFSVTDKDLEECPWLKPAQKEDDVGVIISWNTQAPGATGSPVLQPGAICINPLNWTTEETPADKSLNLGAVFFDDFKGMVKREVPHYTGARVDTETGALVTSPPEELEIGHFPPGVLHKFDYAFWFRNLEKNVKDRVAAYLRQHSH